MLFRNQTNNCSYSSNVDKTNSDLTENASSSTTLTPVQLLALAIRKRRGLMDQKHKDLRRELLHSGFIQILCKSLGESRAAKRRLRKRRKGAAKKTRWDCQNSGSPPPDSTNDSTSDSVVHWSGSGDDCYGSDDEGQRSCKRFKVDLDATQGHLAFSELTSSDSDKIPSLYRKMSSYSASNSIFSLSFLFSKNCLQVMLCSQTISCVRTFCASKAISSHYDIVIVGGGLVGSAMACAIDLNVWKQISVKAQPVTSLYIQDGCSESRISFKQSKPSSPVAYIVENWRIVDALHQCLRESLNIDWKQETSFCELSLPESLDESVVLKLDNGEVVESSLLNDIKNTIAWQRFMPTGPIGILPLNEKLSSLAWTTSTSEAKRLLELPNEEFVKELNGALVDHSGHNKIIDGPLNCFSSILNSIPFLTSSENFVFPTILSLPNNDRAAFPLSLIHAHDYIGNRLALIGDAAHRIHPMAGLGVNLGWSDVVNLTNTLEIAVKEGGDLGSLIYLKNFDAKSQRKNVPIMTAIDFLNSLFSTNFLPSVFVRSVGVNLLDRLWPAKDLMVQYTS
ncbi:unnamed protein product [Meloidogyne enterolobii]|uniref:Uncharacterized protein n=1 Tax=Meloidogyne enterolobii TaxID=390850 RepID=A0ACB0Z2C0_MELEN